MVEGDGGHLGGDDWILDLTFDDLWHTAGSSRAGVVALLRLVS